MTKKQTQGVDSANKPARCEFNNLQMAPWHGTEPCIISSISVGLIPRGIVSGQQVISGLCGSNQLNIVASCKF